VAVCLAFKKVFSYFEENCTFHKKLKMPKNKKQKKQTKSLRKLCRETRRNVILREIGEIISFKELRQKKYHLSP